MASDVQRHLDGMPVIARGDTVSYRTTKFVRRHWLPVTAGMSAAILILAFAMTTYMQSLRISAERDRVAQQRERADMSGPAPRKFELSRQSIQTFRSRGESRQPSHGSGIAGFGAKRLRADCKINRPPRRHCCPPSEWSMTASAVPGCVAATKRVSAASGSIPRRLAHRYAAGTWPRAHRSGRSAGRGAPLQQALHLAQDDTGAMSAQTDTRYMRSACSDINRGKMPRPKSCTSEASIFWESSKAPQTDVSPVAE